MFYGLTNPITFSTMSLTPVGNTVNLFRGGSHAPEGVLLKRITCIEDAIDAGGLLLINKTNPNTSMAKFVFYAGETLKAALRNDLIGKVAARGPSQFSITAGDIRHRNRVHYKYDDTDMYQFQMWREGFAVRPIISYENAFANGTDTIDAWGIVTAATRGAGVDGFKLFGRSNAGWAYQTADNYGFMATDTAMSVSMTQFLMTEKAHILGSVDPDFRSYYTHVYDQIAANRPVKPAISATTVWKNSVLSPLPVVTGGTMYGAPNLLPGYYTDQAPVTGFAGTEAASPINYTYGIDGARGGGYKAYSPLPGEESRAGPGTNFTVHSRFVLSPALGRYHSSAPLLPALVADFTDIIASTSTPSQGSIGAYNVGLLRDAHVFGRSLVDGLRFATGYSVHTNLAELINSTYSTIRDEGALEPAAEATLTHLSALSGADSEYMATVFGSAFAAGELPFAMERFMANLDDAAKAYAESQN